MSTCRELVSSVVDIYEYFPAGVNPKRSCAFHGLVRSVVTESDLDPELKRISHPR